MLYIFVDIDGTIANAERRFKEAGPEPARTDRETYLNWLHKIQNPESLMSDEPVPGMADLCVTLNHQYKLFYLTSREEKWAEVTYQWLAKHNFPLANVIFRPNENWADSASYKEIAIRHTIGSKASAVIVLDDDEHGSIEEMCKRNAFTFLRARSGGQL